MNQTSEPCHVDDAAEESSPWRPFVEGLRRFIASRVPPADAPDVLQDTLLRLHEGSSSLRDADRAEAWVFSIARRTIADYYREEERRPVDGAVEAPEGLRGERGLGEDNLTEYDGKHDVHEEVLSWLRPMADDLKKMYREPLVMADFDGYTQQEVADELGLSLSGAKSRVQRARDKLRQRLEDCCRVQFGPDGRAVAFRPRSAH